MGHCCCAPESRKDERPLSLVEELRAINLATECLREERKKLEMAQAVA